MSQSLAEVIAKKLTEKHQKALQDLYKEKSKFIASLYEGTIPATIKNSAKKFPNWFSKSTYVYVEGVGIIKKAYVELEKSVLVPPGYAAGLELDHKESGTFIDLQRKIESKENSLKTLRKEVEVALLSLKTKKQIEQHLPEALPYLPDEKKYAVAINLDQIRKKIA